jgi:hypothetical protein
MVAGTMCCVGWFPPTRLPGASIGTIGGAVDWAGLAVPPSVGRAAATGDALHRSSRPVVLRNDGRGVLVGEAV